VIEPIELANLVSRWEAVDGPPDSHLKKWAITLIQAARASLSCGLEAQARVLMERAESRLPTHVESPKCVELKVSWNAEGLPRTPSIRREEAQWRQVRSLRSARRPYDGAQHPGKQGLAWGPYNRASAVVEALEAAARIDPLWVDDFLERERASASIDHLLGIAAT